MSDEEIVKGGKSAAESAQEQPAVESAQEQPAVESVQEQPMVESAQERPAAKSAQSAQTLPPETERVRDNIIKLPEDPEFRLRRQKRRRGILLLAILGLLTVIVLLFALLPDVFDLDAIRRYFRYMGKQNREEYGTVRFDAAGSNDFEPLGEGLALGTEGGLYFYDLNGQQESMVQATVASPRLLANEKNALLYAMGSSYMALINEKGERQMDRTLGGRLLDVDLSKDGYICYNLTEDGYKTVSTVLGKNHEPMYRYRSSTQYLNACAISEGGNYLAVAGLTEENSAYATVLSILKTDEEIVAGTEQSQSARRRLSLGNQVVYEMAFLSENRLCVIAQDALLIVDTEGSVVSEHSFEAAYLRGFAISDHGFVALLLGQSVSGDRYELRTVDQNGEILGSLELQQNVRSLDACGKYIAVLSDTELTVYRSRLQTYAETEEIGTAIHALMRDDGTVLLVSNGEAVLFLP